MGDEFGWVEGWSGRKDFGGASDFLSVPPGTLPPVVGPEEIESAPDFSGEDPPDLEPKPPVTGEPVLAAPTVPDVVEPDTMVRALNAALRAAELDPRDGAAVNLARLLARSVDEGRMQDAPKLLSVMTSLGLTPGGRRPPPAAGEPVEGGVRVGPPGGPGGVLSGVTALARIRAARSANGSE